MQPVGSYVNDGFRDMTMAEDHIRHSFSQHLDQMRERYLANIPLVYLAEDYLGIMKQQKWLLMPFTKQIRRQL